MMRRVPSALILVLAAAALPALADDPPAGGATPPAGAAEAPAGAHAEAEWIGDFDRAVEKARAEKKDLLVDFTGSDWCSWCIRLHDEVFEQEAFRPASDRYVLVALDFPRSADRVAKVPNPKRNQELNEKYGIQGYPTVLLMTADGDVYGRTGYQPGGAEKYLAHLDELRTKGLPGLQKAAAAAKAFEDAKDDARPAAAEGALALLETADHDAAWASKLEPAARGAFDLDAANAKGLRLRAAKALLRLGTADDAVRQAVRDLDPKNEQGALELEVVSRMRRVRDQKALEAMLPDIDALDATGPLKDPEVALEVYGNATFWNFEVLGADPARKQEAKRWARKLQSVADKDNPNLQAFIAKVLGEEAEAPKADEAPAPDKSGEDAKDPAK